MTFGGLGMWWFIDATMLLLDAFLWSLGKQRGFVKDAMGTTFAVAIYVSVVRRTFAARLFRPIASS